MQAPRVAEMLGCQGQTEQRCCAAATLFGGNVWMQRRRTDEVVRCSAAATPGSTDLVGLGAFYFIYRRILFVMSVISVISVMFVRVGKPEKI